MRFTRDAGRLVVLGQYTDHGEVTFNPHLDLNRKHLDVLGCWGSDYSHFHRAVQLARDPQRGPLWQRIPLARFGLSQVNDAVRAVRDGSVVKALVDPRAG